MKIAFISYEYPPDACYGGIGTYVYQIARLLRDRGHQVEVFASSPYREGCETEDGIVVHRIRHQHPTDCADFAERIGQWFSDRHAQIQFDVLEGPENQAHARGAIAQVPDIPLVVKLHTPTFMVYEMNAVEPSWDLKLRRVIGALRRGQKPQPFVRWQYDRQSDIEWLHTLDADEITTPSVELGKHLIQAWELDPAKVTHLPNPYRPSTELLQIPVQTQTQTVTFLGRLELRKGVLDLAHAILLIRRHCPEANFRFVGQSCPTLNPHMDMQQQITRIVGRHRTAIAFTGAIPLAQIPAYLAQTDICVFPSLWENFPNVCLEAMAAARGIVGSRAGGMVDMLDQGNAGRLVSPHCPDEIADAVIELLNNPTWRMKLGILARDRVLTEYTLDRIGELQEASYQRAIERRQLAGSRQKLYNLQPVG
ncbi:MAG TPA: glycosyltransferase family 4 protein [Crinalium sp.]